MPSHTPQPALRQARRAKGFSPAPGLAPDNDRTSSEEAEKAIRCRDCGRPVTSRVHETVVSGNHQHTFHNPAGVIFRIGCYTLAEGCAVEGIPTLEHTWFPGLAWSFAFCRGCRLHLGWHFSGSGSSFFGLILNKLVFGS